MAIGDWKKRPDGSLLVSKLHGWEAGLVPGSGVIRLELAATKADETIDNPTVQVVMDDQQLRRIGAVLLKLADQIQEERRTAN